MKSHKIMMKSQREEVQVERIDNLIGKRCEIERSKQIADIISM